MIEVISEENLNDKILADITGLSYHELDTLLTSDAGFRLEQNANNLVSGLSKLFNIRIKDTSRLLGISESRLSRNKQIDKTMLDKAEALISIYSKVANVLADEAATWFNTDNKALENKKPLDLLDTQYGQGKVENIIDALLHGSYL